jgi:pilus assembly protein CpaF
VVPPPAPTLRDQINSAVNAIVQLTRLPDGTRRVTEVSLVTSMHKEDYALTQVLRFETDPWGGAGKVTGRWVTAPLPTRYAERMRLSGQRVPACFQGSA